MYWFALCNSCHFKNKILRSRSPAPLTHCEWMFLQGSWTLDNAQRCHKCHPFCLCADPVHIPWRINAMLETKPKKHRYSFVDISLNLLLSLCCEKILLAIEKYSSSNSGPQFLSERSVFSLSKFSNEFIGTNISFNKIYSEKIWRKIKKMRRDIFHHVSMCNVSVWRRDGATKNFSEFTYIYWSSFSIDGMERQTIRDAVSRSASFNGNEAALNLKLVAIQNFSAAYKLTMCTLHRRWD